MNLLIILGVLALALLIIVPMLEKNGSSQPPEFVQKFSRYFFPLLALLALLQILRHFFF